MFFRELWSRRGLAKPEPTAGCSGCFRNGLLPMLTTTRDRVPAHTADAANEQIRAETEKRVGYLAAHPAEIGRRLKELDAEWDIERAIEANASALAFAGVALGATVDKRWLAISVL